MCGDCAPNHGVITLHRSLTPCPIMENTRDTTEEGILQIWDTTRELLQELLLTLKATIGSMTEPRLFL